MTTPETIDGLVKLQAMLDFRGATGTPKQKASCQELSGFVVSAIAKLKRREPGNVAEPALEAVEARFAELGCNGKSKAYAEAFLAHHGARGFRFKNGQPMKSWRHACATWKMYQERFDRQDQGVPATGKKNSQKMLGGSQ